jgi:hypothetical protein
MEFPVSEEMINNETMNALHNLQITPFWDVVGSNEKSPLERNNLEFETMNHPPRLSLFFSSSFVVPCQLPHTTLLDSNFHLRQILP